MNGPQEAMIGRRLHLNHGPIDLVIEAFGEADATAAAYARASARFSTILSELVEELPALREPSGSRPRPFGGSTACRMEAAVSPLARNGFITPMAAVAGSVADEILATMMSAGIDRAYVNNGGDCALFLSTGQVMQLAVAGTGRGMADRIAVRADDPVRGVATSGWRGRSFSLGIADAVTVLARTAAAADAAATIVANAVDLPGHQAIRREPANAMAPDTDLGDRLVTTGVGPLAEHEAAQALERGLAVAETLRERGLIEAAGLFLAGDVRLCGGAFENVRAPGDLAAGLPSPREVPLARPAHHLETQHA
ncbi:UPF0280 family protein [Mesorhizobium marinum]|uniref:UPF0280 family protein n=1 Tax=Mesorhizobium marinum TaxID=3228790 RepID=UPI0034679331